MDAYVYNGALYCEDHAMDIMADRADQFKGPGPSKDDSNVWPQRVADGGGEADCPQHCDKCGVHLENPLTDDGEQYVTDAIRNKRGDPAVLMTWAHYYDYLIPS